MPELNQKIMHLEMPSRMKSLPVSPEGYPIPWFVSEGGDIRYASPEKIVIAFRHEKCWTCGHNLGTHKTFIIGPMCMVNNINSEPPSHLECAEYAVRACPFLSQPRMRRNEKDVPDDKISPAGIMLARNPGVSVLWTCREYYPFRAHNGVLFRLGPPEHLKFYREGRKATHDEVLGSMKEGLPNLVKLAQEEGTDSICDLIGRYIQSVRWVWDNV